MARASQDGREVDPTGYSRDRQLEQKIRDAVTMYYEECLGPSSGNFETDGNLKVDIQLLTPKRCRPAGGDCPEWPDFGSGE